MIARIFVRSPPPLLKLWSTKGPAAQKIGALFKFVAVITIVKIVLGFFESVLTVTLIVRQVDEVDDERAGRVEPLALQISSLDPTLRIWLEKLGFTTDEDVQKLAKACNGSVRLGLLVLSKNPPTRNQARQQEDSRLTDKTPRHHCPDTLDPVRILLKEAPGEEDATTRSLSPGESNLVEESTSIEAANQVSFLRSLAWRGRESWFLLFHERMRMSAKDGKIANDGPGQDFATFE